MNHARLAKGIPFLNTLLELRLRDEAASRVWMPVRFASKLPSRETAADTLLIFLAKADHAEAIVGDLVEEMQKVRARKSAFVTWLWFWWEVAWVVVKQVGERVRENTAVGRFADAVIRRIGG